MKDKRRLFYLRTLAEAGVIVGIVAFVSITVIDYAVLSSSDWKSSVLKSIAAAIVMVFIYDRSRQRRVKKDD